MIRFSKFSRAKQLASLTAAGASAIALTGAKAEAAIVSSGPLNVSVGFTNNFVVSGPHNVAASHIFNTFQNSHLSSGPKFAVKAVSFGKSDGFSGSSFTAGRGAYARAGFRNTQWGNQRVAPGAVWPGGTGGLIGQFGNRSWGATRTETRTVPPYNFATHASTMGLPSVRNAYMLFRFPAAVPGGFDYGWIEFSLMVANTWGGPVGDPSYTAPATSGPNLTILQYAFDTSGNLLGAGNTGGTATPEPATLAESGLAALVLGAEGLRRWRKARER